MMILDTSTVQTELLLPLVVTLFALIFTGYLTKTKIFYLFGSIVSIYLMYVWRDAIIMILLFLGLAIFLVISAFINND